MARPMHQFGVLMRDLVLALAVAAGAAVVQGAGSVPQELPPAATSQLAASIEAARPHTSHVWRDTVPLNDDGTVNAYIEIARGDRRKWELDMRRNARAIDRTMPESLGGYPVNYGFVPQTVSYDGDPFDALVLGPPIEGGSTVRGAIVGLMQMEDEKGLDSKVVLSLVGGDGALRDRLRDEDRTRLADYFNRYKQHETGKFSEVPGWGSVEEGLAFVRTTHAFFERCRGRAGQTCRLSEPVR